MYSGRKMRAVFRAIVVGTAGSISASVLAVAHYAAPFGTPSGDGSIGRPWDLATALRPPAAVQPGDTIWLRGGTYTIPLGGHVLCGLRGTAAAPITVAQYPGERATIDIKGAAQGLFFTNSPNPAGAAYVNFKNFEVINSDPNRSTREGPVAIYVRLSDHLKFINLIVHDVGIAFDLNTEATNTEVYGSLVYYCDMNDTPITPGGRSRLAHGIYIQNVSGYKKAIDNIVFRNAGFGIHAFPHATDSSLLNVSLIGNIAFNNGSLGSSTTQHPDLLLGGDAIAISPLVEGNVTYKAAPGKLWNQQLGFGAGCRTPRVVNNYFVGTTLFTNCTRDLVLTGNTFYGRTLIDSEPPIRPLYRAARWLRRWTESLGIAERDADLLSVAFPANQYTLARPKGIKVVVRPNRFEPGRANITVYNWDHLPAVNVDVAQILSPGDRFEVRSAQNFFGTPVLSGRYDGRPLRLPMTGLEAASPIGLAAPPRTSPEFNAFVLLSRSHSAPFAPAQPVEDANSK